MTENFLLQAKKYAELGFAIFPCHADSMENSTGDCNPKAPLCVNGVLRATTNETQIQSWWSVHPTANVAIATGKSGLIVLDLDLKNGKNGLEDLAKLCGSQTLPNGPRVETPSGGQHWYFRANPNYPIGNLVGLGESDGIDVRSGNGYVLAPPSTLSTIPYRWTIPMNNLDAIPMLPNWMGEILIALSRLKTPSTYIGMEKTRLLGVDAIPSNAYEPSNDVERRAIAYVLSMPVAVEGQHGHSALYSIATTLIHGFVLPPDVAFRIILDYYNPRCCPPWTESQYSQIQHKIDDAVNGNHFKPLGWLRDVPFSQTPTVDYSEFIKSLHKPKNVIVNNEDCDTIEECIDIKDNTISVNAEVLNNSMDDENIESDVSKTDSEDVVDIGQDPGPLSVQLLWKFPGFVRAYMQYCCDFAPHPNAELAFASAIALVGCLAGRRVCDEMNCRTNIYVMGLANSASGKDFPRSVSMQILTAAGLSEYIGGKIGSGEGLLDSLNRSLNRLHHTDELSVMLSEIASGKSPAKESIMEALLSLYSDSSNVSVQRTLAKQEKTVVYDQPCVCLFGTAIPKLYYGAMNEKMLANGFLSRLFIVDGGERSPTNYRKREPLPERMIEYAKWWANFNPIVDLKTPLMVSYSADAVTAIRNLDALADRECSAASLTDDNVQLSVWGRVSEQTRKLALICAASRYYDFLGDITSLRISRTDVELCSQIVLHTTKRMLWFANRYVASSPTMTLCTKILDKLRVLKKPMSRAMLLKNLHVSSKDLQPAIDTLLERGDIEIDCSNVGTRGPARVSYLLK